MYKNISYLVLYLFAIPPYTIYMKSMISVLAYRILELIDGEKGPSLIPYKLAQSIKLFCLKFIH